MFISICKKLYANFGDVKIVSTVILKIVFNFVFSICYYHLAIII